MDKGKDDPLFEPKSGGRRRGRLGYWMYAVSVYAAIALVLFYRMTHLPLPHEEEEEVIFRRWAWIGFFLAEFWYTFYWFITQTLRWNPINYCTFKDRLSQRFFFLFTFFLLLLTNILISYS